MLVLSNADYATVVCCFSLLLQSDEGCIEIYVYEQWV